MMVIEAFRDRPSTSVAGNMRALAQISETRLPGSRGAELKGGGLDVVAVPQVRGVVAPPGFPGKTSPTGRTCFLKSRAPSVGANTEREPIRERVSERRRSGQVLRRVTERMRGILQEEGVKTVR